MYRNHWVLNAKNDYVSTFWRDWGGGDIEMIIGWLSKNRNRWNTKHNSNLLSTLLNTLIL
jgi:hypothetical protein